MPRKWEFSPARGHLHWGDYPRESATVLRVVPGWERLAIMIRISTIFIAICMVLVAASLGLILYSVAGISGSESAIVALTALTFLILYNAVSMRLRDRSDVGSQIADLSRGTADLARQVAEFGRRLSTIESRVAAASTSSAERMQGVIGEINELGGLVKQLATTVAQYEDVLAAVADEPHPDDAPISARNDAFVHKAEFAFPESRLAYQDDTWVDTHDSQAHHHQANHHQAHPVQAHPIQAPSVKAPPVKAQPVQTHQVQAHQLQAHQIRVPPVQAQHVQAPHFQADPVQAPEVRPPGARPSETRALPEAPAIGPLLPAASAGGSRGQSHILAAVKNAIDENRMDIYLQPLVSLPQRKVRFYEAVTRLRDERDQVLAAEDFIGIAEAAGLVGRIDHMVILRCVQVLRRLLVRNKDVGLFCNVSSATLSNPAIFAQCLDFLEANRALAPSLVLEFKQATLRHLGPTETEHLAALAQRGYRFSIDHVTDLRFEPRDLADRGVRYIKVPAALLLDPKQSSASDIHPSDLSDLLGRFGIDLIAERIEGERSVVDLLDYDIRFGQGFLFAPPRPLRAEGASATAGAAPATSPGQEIKLQDSPGPGTPGSEAAGVNPAPRAGNAALARRIAGTI